MHDTPYNNNNNTPTRTLSSRRINFSGTISVAHYLRLLRALVLVALVLVADEPPVPGDLVAGPPLRSPSEDQLHRGTRV
jgi:hypothetical protein